MGNLVDRRLESDRGVIPFPKSRDGAGVFPRLVAALLLIAALWYLGGRLSHLIQLLLVASFLAFLLNPLVCRLEGLAGLARLPATLIVFTVALGLFALMIVYLLPVILHQVQSLQAGPTIDRFVSQLDSFDNLLNERMAPYNLGEIDLSASLREMLVTGLLPGLIPNALQLAGDVFLVPFILFFLLKDGPLIKKGVIRLVPNRYFEFTGSVLFRVSNQIGNYLRGQALAAIVVGVLAMIALSILGVDYAIAIGTVAGLANVIPYLGPAIGAGLALLVSLATTNSTETLLPIALAFLVIQGIDNTFVQPVVVGRSVRIHPLLIVMAVIVGGTLFGFWGLLLAVPFVVTVQVVAQESAANVKRFDFAP